MMTLSNLKRITDTLNDQGESPVAEEILSLWEHDDSPARFLRISANALFTFQKSGQPCVLRFNFSTERTLDQINAEVDYLNFLAAQGIHVARPVSSLSGKYVESAHTSQGIFHAVVFEAMQGKQFEIADLSLEGFTAWGKALGQLHSVARNYQGADRPTWKDHLVMISASSPDDEKDAQNLLKQLQMQLAELPVHRGNFGLIHFDFELDNLIWNNDAVGIIDFDDCSWYWFAADIAFALRDLFDDDPRHIDLESQPLRAFLDGYQQANQLPQADLKRLPLFLQIHNLLTFCKLLRALDSSPEPDDPDWFDALCHKLQRKLQTYRANFS